MSDEGMVSRVAQAIHDECEGVTGPNDDSEGGHYVRAARRAIEALREQTLVYRDNGQVVHEMRGAPDDIWKTLLDAAHPMTAQPIRRVRPDIHCCREEVWAYGKGICVQPAGHPTRCRFVFAEGVEVAAAGNPTTRSSGNPAARIETDVHPV